MSDLWYPNQKIQRVTGSVTFLKRNVITGEEWRQNQRNLVTTAGDVYYAQKAADETPTNAFTTLEIGTAGASPTKTYDRGDISAFVSSSQKAADGSYPRTNDPDGENTGSGASVFTWRFSYGTSEVVTSGITHMIITVAGASGSEPVLAVLEFAAFNKSASETLKVIVNHSFLGT